MTAGGQTTFIAPPSPEQIMDAAHIEHGPFVVRVALVSGGIDSTVLAHRCRDFYDGICFIDTGTALPGVREHVQRVADLVGKPLVIYDAGVQWRAMVLGGAADPNRPSLRPFGFPGPGQHSVAYNRLKLRQVERLVREVKRKRTDRVALLTGVRTDESQRRGWNVANLERRRGAQVWVSPLRYMTNAEVRTYVAEHDLPLSDVAALIHRSGECNCGCFAAPGERDMLASLWPDWFETTIASVERQAEAAGLRFCRWGIADRPSKERTAWAGRDVGPMCAVCQLQLEGVE